MKNNSIVLLTKDILMAGYLPTYGNKYWSTPNIDELARKGTVFNRHYTAAPSTGMAFTAMMTGKYPLEMTERRRYVHLEKTSDKNYLMEQFEQRGYSCHVLWNDNYLKMALPYSNCFSNAVIHTEKLNQYVGPHKKDEDVIVRNDKTAAETMKKIYNVIDEVSSCDESVFLWIHLPHVLNGRVSYGDDIDLVDELVGYLRNKFSDDNIFISADHGSMSGAHKTFCYGFDVYEQAIRIPLITPRIDDKEVVDWPTSSTQLKDILLNRTAEHKEYVMSDTAYIAQPKRKLAIIHNNYKLIYSKLDNTFELYDVDYDPCEQVNLADKFYYDKDRNRINIVNQVYFYPYWDKVQEEYKYLMNVFENVWESGTKQENKENFIRKLYSKRNVFKNLKTKNLLKKLNSR